MITILDWATYPFYIALIFIIAYVIRSYHLEEPHYRWFFRGLIAKMIGGLAFALIYVYYYGLGDTFMYFHGGVKLSHAFLSDIDSYMAIMFNDPETINTYYPKAAQLIDIQSGASEELFTIKIISLLNFFTVDSYLNITTLISVITFIGSWKCFLSIRYHFPMSEKYIAWAFLLFPTCIFWGSGILKDSIALSALLFFFHYFENFVWQKKRSVIRVLLMIGLALIVFKVKSYIFLAFIPSLVISLYIQFNQQIDSSFIRMIIRPFIFGVALTIAYFVMIYAADQSEKYSLDKIENRSKGFQSWHQMTGGATYTLGDIEYTPTGIIRTIPAALNVTFFRPYIWEVHNLVMLLSALENTFLLFLFLRILFYFRLRMFKLIFLNPLIAFAFTYCMILGFSVGFTSYNFGALARYKVPCMPFFGLILAYLYTIIKQEKEQSQSELQSSVQE